MKKAPAKYNFCGNILFNIKSEPLALRHEYYSDEKELEQTLYLFGRRENEHGMQVFMHFFKNYQNNQNYREKMDFYRKQKKDFTMKDNFKPDQGFLLPEGTGVIENEAWTTKDGKSRKRFVQNICGRQNSIMIVYSSDSFAFAENGLFSYVKNNLSINLGQEKQ